MKREKKHNNFVTTEQLRKMFPGLSVGMVKKYLPAPVKGADPDRKRVAVWQKDEISRIIEQHKELRKAIRDNLKQIENARSDREIAAFLSEFTPEVMIESARGMNRRFILHIGPTNSGKTYQALEALKQAQCGVYLGPLRLLALEVFDKLNDADCLCSLLTGEESIPVPFSRVTASTIEMADYRQNYDVAVIDEAQMITDSDRGSHWLETLCRIRANEVHVCLASEAEKLITEIVAAFGYEPEIVYHQRLAPLVPGDRVRDFDDILPADAVIAFSRRAVLAIAGSLEKRGMRPSVIYGSLPPDARRAEVRKYMEGETNVVVATDAIGMGISLPIRRIVFSTLSKFDGKRVRMLTHSEILQIAGRAGRYGMYDVGEVSSIDHPRIVFRALKTVPEGWDSVTIAFPARDAVESNYPLERLLRVWQRMPKEDGFERENMGEAIELLKVANFRRIHMEREMLFRLISCPVDTDNRELVQYWSECAEAISQRVPIPVPCFGWETLEECELMYKALDLYHQITRRFEMEDDCEALRENTIGRIITLMKESKKDYIHQCAVCGRELPIDSVYHICEHCFRAESGGVMMLHRKH